MLKTLVPFRDVEAIIPNTGIQFLDFGFNIEDLSARKIKRQFGALILDNARDEAGHELFHLRVAEENEDGDYVALGTPGEAHQFFEAEDVYAVDAAKAVEQYCRIWLPLPMLRRRETDAFQDEEFADGPTNWARMYIVDLDSPDEAGNTHRVVMAFDTQLSPRRAEDPYAAPNAEDAAEGFVFSLVSDPLLNRDFLAKDWVRSWLRSAFADRLSAKKGKTITSVDLHDAERFPKRGEYWASFHMLLEGMQAVCKPPKLRFVDTIRAPQEAPVEVDVMIDIGNSRTCGMLIEDFGEKAQVDITKPQRMEVRDLSHPEQVYAEPIESWLEFYPASFGYDNLARAAGRTLRPAFFWPSPVRVGPEAARMAVKSDGTEGVTGMSSPKRYLWDKEARTQSWANNPSAPRPTGEAALPIKGPFVARLTERGIPVELAKGPDKAVGMEPRYSRSSMFMFLVAEILLHVVAQINSVSARGQNQYAQIPRRLRTVALTLPSATPVAEQRIMKKNAEYALNLVWQSMGWPTRKGLKTGTVDAADALFLEPEVKLDWDEASCTHLVYLYNEILERFRGRPAEWFELMGRRKTEAGDPALRVASIDIGGGTTDLMIIQHESSGRATVHPRQLLREGFRQAGDDVVKAVSEQCVMASITEALVKAGAKQPYEILPSLFGSERDDFSASVRNQRALFVSQIVAAAATGLLERMESVDLSQPHEPIDIALRDLLPREFDPQSDVLGFLGTEASKRGATDFDVLAVPVRFDVPALHNAIAATLTPTLQHLCDMVRAYECDVLILTGRPSRLPSIQDIVLSQAPVHPHRIVSLHDYDIGPWYPFRSPQGLISDPKTTVVVGAMLCKICEGGVEGLFMRASELKMWSTARFLGPMDKDDRIKAQDVCQEDLTPENVVEHSTFTIKMDAPFFIGFRQLPLERWPASPLMYVYFKETGSGDKLHPPYTLTFERVDPKNDEDPDDLNEAMETFRLSEAEDAEGNSAKTQIGARLQTLRVDRAAGTSYWLDSGVLDLQTLRGGWS